MPSIHLGMEELLEGRRGEGLLGGEKESVPLRRRTRQEQLGVKFWCIGDWLDGSVMRVFGWNFSRFMCSVHGRDDNFNDKENRTIRVQRESFVSVCGEGLFTKHLFDES